MLIEELDAPAERVAAMLRERGETVAVAEGSAGGLISAALLAVPGASAYFVGGAVVYTARANRAWMAGAVEPPPGMRGATEGFADYLARSAAVKLGADWGIGEAGAAGPANPYGDPAGHCWVAVARATSSRRGTSSRASTNEPGTWCRSRSPPSNCSRRCSSRGRLTASRRRRAEIVHTLWGCSIISESSVLTWRRARRSTTPCWPRSARRDMMDFGVAMGYGIAPKPDFWIGLFDSGEGFRESHIAFEAADRADRARLLRRCRRRGCGGAPRTARVARVPRALLRRVRPRPRRQQRRSGLPPARVNVVTPAACGLGQAASSRAPG